MKQNHVTDSSLGKSSEYPTAYDPSLLFPIPRSKQRPYIEKNSPLPFHGVDIWTGYELSWLNPKGKPMVAIGKFVFPCESTNILESKSFKLYLNSFNQTCLASPEQLKETLEKDLSQASGGHVIVDIILPDHFPKQTISTFPGMCIDDLDVAIDLYQIDAGLLSTTSKHVEEKIFSRLLKSNCPVTGQPDWATVWFHYVGNQIDHHNLLKYIISFRNHQDFHEHCIEMIFADIMNRCNPDKLSVYARYTRRGGLDINPFRSNFETEPLITRLCQQ